MRCNTTSWSFDAFGTGISVTLFQQPHKCHHHIKTTEIRCIMTFCQVMPLTSTFASYGAIAIGVGVM